MVLFCQGLVDCTQIPFRHVVAPYTCTEKGTLGTLVQTHGQSRTLGQTHGHPRALGQNHEHLDGHVDTQGQLDRRMNGN